MQEAQETEHRPDSDSDEINLYALFQVIWKKKSLIIAIFLIAVIAAAVISYMLPTVYRVTAAVAPGWIDTDNSGKAILLDTAENIKSLIENDSFNPKIIEALKLDPVKYPRLGFKTKLARNTEALSVYYDTNDVAQGKLIMGELLKQLTDYYKARILTRFSTIDTSIEMLKNQNINNENKKARIVNNKKTVMGDITLLKDKEKVLKVTEKYLTKQLQGVDDNTKTIIQQRNDMLKKGETTDSVALLLYSNTVQQNISYIDSLNANLERNRLDQDSAKNDIIKNEMELKNKDTELRDVDTDIMNNLEKINALEFQKLRIEGLRIIQEPYSDSKPVGPRKRLNVAVAGVSSLFFGIFLVFFLEFLKKAKASSETEASKPASGQA